MAASSKHISLNDGRAITLRAVINDDEPFLIDVYGSTRQEELALVEWTDAQRQAFTYMQYAAQKAHYQSYYPNAEYEVILLDEQPVGRLWVARLDDEIRILDITLLQQHRGKGIGTPIIEQLMNEGRESGKPVHIYVEQYNPSLRLFERLGFFKVDEYGYSHKMRWVSTAEPA